MPFEFIFPMSRYGQLSDVYGSAVPQYANTPGGFPQGAGLRLGEFGILFDGTFCQLLKALSGVNPFDGVYVQPNNGNPYQVLQTTAPNQFVVGANDRSGNNPLVANNIAWFTTHGLATVNTQSSLNAGTMLVSSNQPGFLGPYTPGVTNLSNGTINNNSTQLSINLLNTAANQGPYPVLFK